MKKIVICDDDHNQIDLMKNYIETYALSKNLEVEISAASSSLELETLIKESPFDVAFLDMEIDDKTGLDLAGEIKALNKKTIIVFVTGYDRYAQRAFDLRAFNYIMKPVLQEQFINVMDEIMIEYNERSFLKSNLYGKYVFRGKGETIELLYEDILCFQKEDRLIRIICSKKDVMIRSTLSVVQKDLDLETFIRCHEGYIVNINKVFGYKDMMVTIRERDLKIPVSRRKIKAVKDAIIMKLWG